MVSSLEDEYLSLIDALFVKLLANNVSSFITRFFLLEMLSYFLIIKMINHNS